jgi:hypothetical protein
MKKLSNNLAHSTLCNFSPPVYFIASICLIFSTLQELLTGSPAAFSLPSSDNKMK